MATSDALFLGLDFGTESVRAIVVDRRGRERGSAVSAYRHGQIAPGSAHASALFERPLPPAFALQHPGDWLESAAAAIRDAVRPADAERIESIGVDFTSCTMLPCASDGTPLCLLKDRDLARNPHAWPKLWKHHGAIAQTETFNRIARERSEPFLERYGGIVGLEWFFPKIFEALEDAPQIFNRAEVWLEGGDWLVWQLVGGDAGNLPRSTCQAGYKACWSREDSYPSRGFLEACHPQLGSALDKLPGRFIAPGECAGALTTAMAKRLGLRTGIAVSAAIIDAHAGVPGAGVAEAGALVMVLGTSGCHMLLADDEVMIPGVAGIVRDGILPGFVGYETGQAAMGDAFDWARRLLGHADFEALDRAARDVAPGADGLVCLDWFNGCRTPLMDGGLKGSITGLTLQHTPAHVYRAVLEASAMGLRWVVETLRGGTGAGVAVTRFVATGGLPHHNPLFVEIIASSLGAPVEIHAAQHGPALGAAILGACAAGAFGSVSDAVAAIAGARSERPAARIVTPDAGAILGYESLYQRYRDLAEINLNTD